MMVATLTASAQWSVTPKVGMNLATITNGNDAKMKVGLVAGADLAYRVSDMFAVSVGAFYSMQGAKGKHRIHQCAYSCQRVCSSRIGSQGWYSAGIQREAQG